MTESSLQRYRRLAHEPKRSLFQKLQKKVSTVYLPRIKKPIEKIEKRIKFEWQMQQSLTMRAQFDNKSKGHFFVFGFIDWEFRFQRPQQLARALRDEGYTVWYIPEHVCHTSLNPLAQNMAKIRKLENHIYELQFSSSHLYNLHKDTLSQKDALNFSQQLLHVVSSLGLSHLSLLVEHPFWEPIIEKLPYFSWYDCMDDHQGFRVKHKNIASLEEKLIQTVSGIFVTSSLLAQKFTTGDKPCTLIPNATDPHHFSLSTQASVVDPYPHIPHPRIGYFGALDYWFDPKLIAYAAQKHPDWNFILIGSVTYKPILRTLSKYANVHFLGEVPYNNLPQYAHSWNVGCIPFSLIPLIKATSPVKFFEMRAAGLPIVSSPLPELLSFQGTHPLWLANNPEKFEQALQKAIANKKTPVSKSFLYENSWQKRAQALLQQVQGLQPMISIIIISYENFEITQACIESVLQDKRENKEIILIDNASSPSTQKNLRNIVEKNKKIHFIQNTKNKGFAAANNQGAKVAKGKILIFLNNDTQVSSDWLDRVLYYLQDPSIGILGPVTNMIGNEARVIFTENLTPQQYLFLGAQYARQHLKQQEDIPMLAGFCWALRREVFEKVGLLDERFGVGMFEDDDYCLRVRQAGYRVVLAHDLFIYHYGRAAFSQLSVKKYQDIFATNKAAYEKKWKKTWQPHQYKNKK